MKMKLTTHYEIHSPPQQLRNIKITIEIIMQMKSFPTFCEIVYDMRKK